MQGVTVDLVYFDAGGGHRSAALALQAAIARQRRPWTVRLVNLTVAHKFCSSWLMSAVDFSGTSSLRDSTLVVSGNVLSAASPDGAAFRPPLLRGASVLQLSRSTLSGTYALVLTVYNDESWCTDRVTFQGMVHLTVWNSSVNLAPMVLGTNTLKGSVTLTGVIGSQRFAGMHLDGSLTVASAMTGVEWVVAQSSVAKATASRESGTCPSSRARSRRLVVRTMPAGTILVTSSARVVSRL